MYDEYGEYDEQTDLRIAVDDKTYDLELEVATLQKTVDEKSDEEVLEKLERIQKIVNEMQAHVGELIWLRLREERRL